MNIPRDYFTAPSSLAIFQTVETKYFGALPEEREEKKLRDTTVLRERIPDFSLIIGPVVCSLASSAANRQGRKMNGAGGRKETCHFRESGLFCSTGRLVEPGRPGLD